MGFLFKKCGLQRVLSLFKAKPTGNMDATLKRLRSFLDAEEPQTVLWLGSMWDKQQTAITYRELREMIISWDASNVLLEKWQEDYSKLVNTKLAPQWAKAMATAAEERKRQFPYLLYDPGVGAAQEYIRLHGAELVTNLVAEQRNAIQNMVARAAYYDGVPPDSLARALRSIIGLTTPQAKANLNYWKAAWDAGAEAGLSIKAIEERASKMAATYAARQHRERAMTIARTELASAYNEGAYGATRAAQEQGYIGDCKKVWVTAGEDERLCSVCAGVDGESVNMDAAFSNGIKLPPAHPRCRCGVAFEEVAEGVNAYDLNNSLDENSSNEYNVSELRKYYPEDDVNAIIGALKDAHEDAVAVWNKYADQIKFDSITDNNARYSPKTKGVYIDLSKELNNPRGPYGTTFHEIGHLFDNMSTGGYLYSSVSNREYLNKIYQDYANFENSVKDLMKQGLRRNPKIAEVREFISETIKGYGGAASGVSDIISGITLNKVSGGYTHSNNYWKSDADKLPKEAFAQMYQAAILRGDKEELMKEVFPSAYEEFVMILRKMVK